MSYNVFESSLSGVINCVHVQRHNIKHLLHHYSTKRYGVLVLDRPGADSTVGLPEADGMVVSGRGQNNRVAAHRSLVHVHAWTVGRQSLS